MSQIGNPEINVLTGQPFNEQVTYQQTMRLIGGDDSPTGIQIYPKSFETKDLIKDYLDLYNEGKAETDSIIYTQFLWK